MRLTLLTLLLGFSLWVTAQSKTKTFTADSTTAYTLRVATSLNADDMPILSELSDADSQSVIDPLLFTEPLGFEDSKQGRSGISTISFDFQTKEKPKTDLNIFTPSYKSGQD